MPHASHVPHTLQAAKEPHIFDHQNALLPGELHLYSSDTRPGWVLDATPDYMDVPLAACRIHRWVWWAGCWTPHMHIDLPLAA